MPALQAVVRAGPAGRQEAAVLRQARVPEGTAEAERAQMAAARACTIPLRSAALGLELRRTSIKEMLGHESLDTLKHYAKLTITDIKAAQAKCHPREKDARSEV